MEASAFVLPQEAIDKIFQEAPTRYDWRKIYKLARIITFYKYYNHDAQLLQRILWELNRYLNQLDTIIDHYQIQLVTEDLLNTEIHIRKDVFNLAFESLNNNAELKEFFQMDEEPSDELTMELFKTENQVMMVKNSHMRHDFFWLQERQPVPIELERILGKSVFQKVQEFVPQELVDFIPSAQEVVDVLPSRQDIVDALPSRQDIVDAIPTSEDLVKGVKTATDTWVAIQWAILTAPYDITAFIAGQVISPETVNKLKLVGAVVVTGGVYVYTQ